VVQVSALHDDHDTECRIQARIVAPVAEGNANAGTKRRSGACEQWRCTAVTVDNGMLTTLWR